MKSIMPWTRQWVFPEEMIQSHQTNEFLKSARPTVTESWQAEHRSGHVAREFPHFHSNFISFLETLAAEAATADLSLPPWTCTGSDSQQAVSQALGEEGLQVALEVTGSPMWMWRRSCAGFYQGPWCMFSKKQPDVDGRTSVALGAVFPDSCVTMLFTFSKPISSSVKNPNVSSCCGDEGIYIKSSVQCSAQIGPQ